MRKWSLVLTIAACVVAVAQATAAPRNSGPRIDVTFGRGGAALLRAPSTVTPGAVVPRVPMLDGVADRDGRAYVLFAEYDGTGAVLAAYDAEGRLDRRFGHRGAVALDALGRFRDVALDSDGRVLVLGVPAAVRVPGQYPTEAVVVRVLPDGRLDPAFGFGGIQRQASPALTPREVLPDGSGGVLVLARGVSEPRPWLVFRLGTDGELDRTYGDDGVAVVPRVGAGGLSASVYAVDAAGRFVVLDSTNEAGGEPPGLALVRLDASGDPDPTFGEQGRRVLDFGAHSVSSVVLGVDALGRYVLLGGGDATFVIARLLADGTPDATWSGTADGVREILTDDDATLGTNWSTLKVDGVTYYAAGGRSGPSGPDHGDAVVVRVDDGGEQVWTSESRRFAHSGGFRLLGVSDGTVLAAGYVRDRRPSRRTNASLVRLRFD